MMEHHELMDRLAALRATIRRRLVVYGVFAVASGGIVSFVTITLIDWIVRLPPLLRILIGMLFFGGFVWATIHWIVKPLRVQLGIGEIAAKLEKRFSQLQDRLSSTVNFIQSEGFVSEPMRRKVVADTERIIKQISLESSLSLRPILVRGVVFVAGMLVFSVLAISSPDWVRTGLYRYLHPFGAIEWPRLVSIEPLTGDQVVALGESVTVSMNIRRGLDDSLRGIVRLIEPDGTAQTLALTRARDGTFHTTIDAVTEDLAYYFEAGDDSTRRRPFIIRAVRRPEIVEALATVEPPAYARSFPVRVQDLGDGPVIATVASRVRLMLRASKPISSHGRGSNPCLRLESGAPIPLLIDEDDGRSLSADFEVLEDRRFRVEVWDEHGLSNRGAESYTITAVPDERPSVTILQPRAATELTPTGSVPLLIHVTDDYGVTLVTLSSKDILGEDTRSEPLGASLDIHPTDIGVEVFVEHLWNMAPSALSPGDVIEYWVSAVDNEARDSEIGKVGESTRMRLKIISETEFEVRVRSDLAVLETRIRQVALDQSEILDRTEALIRGGLKPSPNELERDELDHLAAAQGGLIRRVRHLSRGFATVGARLDSNRAGRNELRERVASTGEVLRETASVTMTRAGDSLSQAREETHDERRTESLLRAVDSERASADRLLALVRSMSRWGRFQGLIAKTRSLRDRQDVLREDMIRQGKSVVGKPVGKLTPKESASLNRTRRRQEQLADDIKALLDRLRVRRAAATDSNEAGVGAIEDALRAASAHDVTRHAADAVEAIKSNRTAAAALEQRAAARALERIGAALEEQRDRELAELHKRLVQLEEQVARLIEDQRGLRDAVEEAGLLAVDEPEFANLSRRQRSLKRNTRLLGQELIESQRVADAGRIVRQASDTMGRAEVELDGGRAGTAAQAQDQALELLEKALVDLEQRSRNTADEAFRRSLARIRENLEAMLAAQQKVNARIGTLRESTVSEGRLDRAQAGEASKLAHAQTDVRSMVDSMLPDLERVVVYRWALERVARWMDDVRSALQSRRIDGALAGTSVRIVHEIEKLVRAIADTEALPAETEFVEAESGGGGDGATGNARPVPTVAELLVLKAMQVDINERTKSAAGSLNIDDATNEQLNELKTIGEDQSEVRRLTEMVTNRARNP